MLIIIGATILSILLYFVLIKPFHYWRDVEVKHIKPVIIFGNFARSTLRLTSFVETLQGIYNAFPNARYCGFYLFLKRVLMVRDLELIRQIAIKDFDSFVDHQKFITENEDPLWGKNLIAMSGDKWRSMRTTLSPSFTGIKMKAMFQLIDDCAIQFVDYFKQKSSDVIPVATKNTFTRFTNDVIATCAFGISCNSLINRENDFYTYGLKATDFSGVKTFKFLGFMVSPTLMKLLKVKVFDDDTATFFRGVIKDTIKLRAEQNLIRPDMIQLLVEERKKRAGDDNKAAISDDDITAQALIFFFAGFEPSSSFMEFFTWELAMNRDIQTRLRAEIMQAFHANDGKLSYETVKGLKYLEMCESEVLRKWPPTPSTDRQATRDYTIKAENPGENDLFIPKGSVVFFPVHGIHHDPKYWPNPDKFDPERFSEENKKEIHPAAYLPFGIGPRICIGNRFILMEVKLIICHILQHFEIVPLDETPRKINFHRSQFNLYPEKPIVVGFKRID